jgi:hypothetical protein
MGSGRAITSSPKPSAGDEILQMVEKCIDMAVRARELSYRVHVSEAARSTVNLPPDEGVFNKSCSFSTGAVDRIDKLQAILRDVIETLEDFV